MVVMKKRKYFFFNKKCWPVFFLFWLVTNGTPSDRTPQECHKLYFTIFRLRLGAWAWPWQRSRGHAWRSQIHRNLRKLCLLARERDILLQFVFVFFFFVFFITTKLFCILFIFHRRWINVAATVGSQTLTGSNLTVTVITRCLLDLECAARETSQSKRAGELSSPPYYYAGVLFTRHSLRPIYDRRALALPRSAILFL